MIADPSVHRSGLIINVYTCPGASYEIKICEIGTRFCFLVLPSATQPVRLTHLIRSSLSNDESDSG